MKKVLRLVAWVLPLALHIADAHAWGLVTHVYFAQYLIWGAPLADPTFRRALKRFPELVMAGACLPDLSLFGHSAGTAAFGETHRWQRAVAIAQRCEDDRERAIALGYGTHLLADTVAHNHFVPAHEDLWLDVPMLTHALAEWAMDSYLRPRVQLRPAQLVHRHQAYLAGYVTAQFGSSIRESTRALSQLKFAEYLLRGLRIPEGIYRVSRSLDSRLRSRFGRYVGATTGVLRQIDALLAGHVPAMDPNPPRQSIPGKSDLPTIKAAKTLFGAGETARAHSHKDVCAIRMPTPAPAKTSLG